MQIQIVASRGGDRVFRWWTEECNVGQLFELSGGGGGEGGGKYL